MPYVRTLSHPNVMQCDGYMVIETSEYVYLLLLCNMHLVEIAAREGLSFPKSQNCL